jgi:hypothetical protein
LLGLRKLVARIEEISYLSQSINKTRWERLNRHFVYQEDSRDQREISGADSKHKRGVKVKKQAEVQSVQCCTADQTGKFSVVQQVDLSQ